MAKRLTQEIPKNAPLNDFEETEKKNSEYWAKFKRANDEHWEEMRKIYSSSAPENSEKIEKKQEEFQRKMEAMIDEHNKETEKFNDNFRKNRGGK